MTCAESQDLNQPLAEWRACHQNHQFPKHYHDIAPKPPTALPLASLQAISDCPLADPRVFPAQQSPVCTPLAKRLLKSVHNVFGLFRQYYTECFLHHDPNKNITQNDLIDSSPDSPCTLAPHDYYPYPNQSYFLLGE